MTNQGMGASPSQHRATNSYATVWRITVTTMLAIGSVSAVDVQGLQSAATIWICGAVMSGAWLFAFSAQNKFGLLTVVGQTALGGVVLTAVIGWSSIVHAWVIGIVVVLVAAWPTVWRWAVGEIRAELVDRQESTDHDGRDAGRQPTNVRIDPVELDDGALCRAWRDTGRALDKRLSTRAFSQLIEYRERCLDEIERRNPEASSEWLDAGPPIGVDSKVYLPPTIRGCKQ